MNRILLNATIGLSLFASATAIAASGYVVGNVALHAGPDGSYPTVGMLNAGAPVAIEGCVNGWSWCDVGTPYGRGWVPGNSLQEDYQGQRVLVPAYGERIGIRFVVFDFGTYWDSNYRNRPWYGERERYRQFRPTYQPIRIDLNVHSDPSHGHGRNDHGGDHRPPHDRSGNPNHGVEPRAPGYKPPHSRADAKPAQPKAAEPKPQKNAGPKQDNSKAEDQGQGQH